MNPGNKIRPYEYVVYLLVILNGIMVSFLLGFSGLGDGFSILFGALSAVIPLVCNRLDPIGLPQGATYVQLVNEEGTPVEIPKD